MKVEEVILVNEQDQPIGRMEKMEVHRKGLLHRAFSVFIFNSRGEMLLQQRADEKYHSGGLWSNACCSHPAPDESVEEAASRRLQEELGFRTPLNKLFSFVYRAEFTNGLTEHEYDHVFTGTYDGEISPDRDEVKEYRFIGLEELEGLLKTAPEQFTAWFLIVYPKIQAQLKK